MSEKSFEESAKSCVFAFSADLINWCANVYDAAFWKRFEFDWKVAIVFADEFEENLFWEWKGSESSVVSRVEFFTEIDVFESPFAM
jgi:hypothetical protein